MHNTTWAPNTMLSCKKNWRANSKETSERRMDRPYLYDPSGHGQGSYKRISQLRGIAVVNKNKIQYISA